MDDAAVYGVAYSLANAMSLFVTSVNSSLIPWTYQRMSSGDSAGIRKIGEVGLALSVALAAIVLLGVGLGPELMAFLAPESYSSAVWVIPPVGFSVLASMYMWLFVNVETYYGENTYVAIVSIGAAVLNVVLNFVTLPAFGFLAAGWTTLVSYSAMAIGHAFFMRVLLKRHGTGPVYRIRLLVMLAVAVLVLTTLLMALYQFTLARYALILALCVVAIWKRGWLLSAIATIRDGGKNESKEQR